jgi:2-polyprenyl-3-methyl-5-hydroxy-6-metoxy-1,4-benzoquinol methylase
LRAEAPHDAYSFEQLASAYNFERTSHRARVFTRLVINECRQRSAPIRVLDIGCGKGIEMRSDYQWAIREHADEYVGLEPDVSIKTPQGLFHDVQRTVMEQADLPANHFDVAYSFMVMEHVDNPDEFMRAVWRSLKPGGVYLFATPNRRHNFTRIASLLHTMRLDEHVLRAVSPEAKDEYHYPVRYRFNSEKQINACAARAGFQSPHYLYLEEVGPRSCFPGPTRLIFHALAMKRRIIRNPKSLVTLVCRVIKPAS